MPTPAADSGLLAPVWAGTPVESLTDDNAWLRAMLYAEAALARAQARLGLIPFPVATSITEAAEKADLDLVDLARRSRAAANPVVALVPAFTAVVAELDPTAAEYVHRGSTSQDILDTASMLVVRDVFRGIGNDLRRVASALATLADEHRGTLAAGRTLTQHAVPTTFGLKAATWLQLVLDASDRVQDMLARGLPAELGGAAGTLSAYAAYAEIDTGTALAAGGVELLAPFAEEAGLAEPVTCWHVARTPITETGSVLQLVCGALGKIALDVQFGCRTEVGELAEPVSTGRGSSSAMPQKRNPALATLVLAAARQVPAHTLVLAQSMLAEDERPGGAWHAEWQPLREALRLAGGAAHTATELCCGLRVDRAAMARNLTLTGGAILAERLNAALAPTLGKAAAKNLLADAAREADRSGQPFTEVVGEQSDVRDTLGGRLPGLCDPAGYLGAANDLIDRVLDRYRTAQSAASTPDR